MGKIEGEWQRNGEESFSLRISFDGPESIIQDGIRLAGEFYRGTVYKEYLVEADVPPDLAQGKHAKREPGILLACL